MKQASPKPVVDKSNTAKDSNGKVISQRLPRMISKKGNAVFNAIVVFGILINIAFWAFVVFAILHFIFKFW